MENMPKFLIAVGVALIVIGLIWMFGGRFLRFGHLPGDIAIERENFKFYFPLGTSIILSLVLSFILWLIQRLGR